MVRFVALSAHDQAWVKAAIAEGLHVALLNVIETLSAIDVFYRLRKRLYRSNAFTMMAKCHKPSGITEDD